MSVKLDSETRSRLDQLAQSCRRILHRMLREAVAQYVEREEKREVFRQDTPKAWEEYRTTGLPVTAGEADAWLAQLADGDDIEPPECHI
ncbi:CopG family transcriptional regulator [Actimicrobium antarcticum]